jgi:hypothetical protein
MVELAGRRERDSNPRRLAPQRFSRGRILVFVVFAVAFGLVAGLRRVVGSYESPRYDED